MVWYGVTVVLCRYDLMRKCWTLEPSDRPTFTECCHHIRNMILLDHSALCSVNHLPQSPYFFRSGTDLMSLLICCYCACAWWGESLKRSLYMLRRFEIWQDCSSSKCASTDRRRIFDLTSHTVKMAAVTSFHAEKCCHLVSGAYAATYASS